MIRPKTKRVRKTLTCTHSCCIQRKESIHANCKIRSKPKYSPAKNQKDGSKNSNTLKAVQTQGKINETRHGPRREGAHRRIASKDITNKKDNTST